MTNKQLCEMCTEYNPDVKCDHKNDCKLLGILKENKKLKAALRELKKELSENSWRISPDMMGR